MTEDKEISKKELKRLRTMIEQGQKLSISTKEFEKVFDEIERLEQESMTKSATFCNYEKQLDELKQENKELKAYKDVSEDFKKAWDDLNEKYKQLRSALEEIRTYLNTLSSIDNDFPNTETYLRINDKIEEVLNHQEG